jgi:hypothetical protein
VKYLPIATAVAWLLTYWAFAAASKGGDDFGAGLLYWLVLVVAALLSLITFVRAFFLH